MRPLAYAAPVSAMKPAGLLFRAVLSAALAAALAAAPVGIASARAVSTHAGMRTGVPAQASAGAGQIASTASTDGPWWKHAVLYEIYPRSFQDSNGDGIGDLNGITERLGYLESFGADAIWIAPMYPSPQVDFGYDISDYENVDPQYGTLADFDRLISEGKKHHIRVILDMVMNHTSDQHKWFIESSSSRSNPKANWYVWQDPKGYKPDGTPLPPNNWVSLFGGSAWQWVPARKQFYYHKFYRQQPDLNWRNPEVEAAMFATIRFWLDRGVAGFRFDAIPTLFEDPQLRDEPVLGGTNAQGDPRLEEIYTSNLPEVHGVMRRMRAMVDKYPGNRVLIGETYLPNAQELDKWYGGAKHDELELPMDMQVGFTNKLDASLFRTRIEDAETRIDGNQPLFVFDNHDNIRSWDRYGDGAHNVAIAKLLATMLFTTKATALMYYGQELGMVTTTPSRREDVKDPIGITGWPKEKGRDGERTPMQWNAGKDAGFSTAAKTWLPIPPNYKTLNVKTEEDEPDSLLNWYKQLIALRRDNPALHDGSFTMLDRSNPSVLSYLRKGTGGDASALIALNFTAEPQTVTFEVQGTGLQGKAIRTLITDAPSLQTANSLRVTLPPFASWVGSVR
ncbi:MAG: glycoside hydrolase family 13 protein [Acidobacteriaceae bacterium]